MQMLDRPFEISLHARDTSASFDFYRRLGFVEATAGDIWPHAYGAMCCAELALGLHGEARHSLVITFVRPDVARLHRELAAMDIPVERAVLGSDAFNLIELADPDGTALRVIEARSFSAPAEVPVSTALGVFRHLSLPTLHPARAEDFWRRLGLADTWELAWHHPAELAGAALVFRHADPAAAADILEARGFDLEERPLEPGHGASVQLRTHEDLLLRLHA